KLALEKRNTCPFLIFSLYSEALWSSRLSFKLNRGKDNQLLGDKEACHMDNTLYEWYHNGHI
ncbi:hypothetical protein KZZ20_11200, partial [Methylacidiphilum fumariolicum]|uniref:hypothetical protein n=1 Tax=Candidatus Methylacidiphilum fumarolicum TaxID=591154 RepID=UPI001CA5B575